MSDGAIGKRMKTVNYTIDLTKDPKSMIRMVRDDLQRLLSSPGATNVESGLKKIRFYDWCLEHDDGLEKFDTYCHTKRRLGEEAGFKAAGWTG